MKRASPVLAFACLAAIDLLVVLAVCAFFLWPAKRTAPLGAESAVPLRPTSATESSANAARSASANTRTSVVTRCYRPKLAARYSDPVPERTIAGWAFVQQGDEWNPLASAIVRLWRGRNYNVRVDVELQSPLLIRPNN